jgi:RNA polymerase sigma-70 factor, ECF subfamily
VPPGVADGDLVVAALSGDRLAFRALVDRYYDACGRYATRMLGRREEAEDVVQETFLRVHRNLGAYEERQSFRSWLWRILLNECRSAARRRTRRDRRFLPESTASEAAFLPDAETDPGLRDALQRALDGLEPRMREAFLLKFGEGLEYAEIAMLTGASVSALKMRVKRAREAMRPALEAMTHD